METVNVFLQAEGWRHMEALTVAGLEGSRVYQLCKQMSQKWRAWHITTCSATSGSICSAYLEPNTPSKNVRSRSQPKLLPLRGSGSAAAAAAGSPDGAARPALGLGAGLAAPLAACVCFDMGCRQGWGCEPC